MLRTLSASALLLMFAAPALAQRDAKVPDTDPEVERKSFTVADGFEVNLYAADPLLAKPIQMNFDAKGRLWVACSETYPQIKPGQTANDKVIILEDSNADGRADKTTVFADGLLIPTGVEPDAKGGAFVADSTDLLHLSDPGPDGKARKSRVVLSGFGTEDTHHIIHTFRTGPDGCLYFNQSVYIHSHVETPHGPRRLNAGGVWKLHPESLRLEVFARGFWNPWGHQFDRWGRQFGTDGANFEGVTDLIPGASYPAAHEASRVLNGLNPGSPKHCGLEIVSGRHMPDDWQGDVLTNDFRGHRVCRFKLSEDGAGFASVEKPELIKSNHPAFRPIDVVTGPDGAIYIADWYNPIIQHGEVDFRDPRRDHTHGRIWRVTAKGRPALPVRDLAKLGDAELLDCLKAPEQHTRHHAKQVLAGRGRGVLAAALSWLGSLPRDEPDFDHHILEVLWLHQQLDEPNAQLPGRLLDAKDHRARAAAARFAGRWSDRVVTGQDLRKPPEVAARALRQLADDRHPRVRLEAVRALATIPDQASAVAALAVLDKPMDKWLDYALWLTLRELEPHWLPAFREGKLTFGGDAKKIAFALSAVGGKDALKPLVELVKGGKVAKENEAGVLALLIQQGGPAELALAFERVIVSPHDERNLSLVLEFVKAATLHKVRPAGDLSRASVFLDGPDHAGRVAGAKLAGAWKLAGLAPRLTALAQSPDHPDGQLVQACVGALADIGRGETLAELCKPPSPVQTRTAAVVALAGLDAKRAAASAVTVIADPKAGDPTPVVSAFLARKGGPQLLADQLAGKTLTPDVAKAALRAVRSAGREEKGLVEALTRAGKLGQARAAPTPDELAKLMAEVRDKGDPHRGEAVYRRKDLNCTNCHNIAGAGGVVGPELTSLGASAQVDYLLESILVPNKAIKENYHTVRVVTGAGRVLAGVKVRETKSELVLRDAEGKELAVAADDIDERGEGRSLMPEGLIDGMTHAEFIDLVRFLSELGKGQAFSAGTQRVVRTYQVLVPTQDATMLLVRSGLNYVADPSRNLSWSPALTTVAGELPLSDVPKLGLLIKGVTTSVARFQLECSAGGPVRLNFGDPAGLSVWVDGATREPSALMTLDLSPGEHVVTVAVDPAKRQAGLRVALDDVPGSPARVRIAPPK